MAKFKLVTDVSKLGLFQSVARTRGRLVITTLVALALAYGFGFWSAHYILEQSQSVIVNLFLITGNMFLVLAASFLTTVLIGDLSFSGPWRQEVFLKPEGGGSDEAPIDDHSGEFMVLLLIVLLVNAVALNFATGGFFDEYHSEGYFKVRLRSDNPDDRVAAFRELTGPLNYDLWQRPGLQEVTVETFDDPSPKVREMAVWSAGKMKLESASEELIEVLKQDEDPGVRAEAAVALGKLGPEPTARRAAEEALREASSTELKIGALRGLGLMASSSSVDVVEPFVDAEDESVMSHAFWVLRKIGDESARPKVRQVLDADPTGVRKCGAFDAMKKVATGEDMLWARRQFQKESSRLGEKRGDDECERVVWEDRDEEKRPILVGDSFRVKLLKIVANEAAHEYRSWFQRIVNDPSQPWRVREVANEIIRQLDGAMD